MIIEPHISAESKSNHLNKLMWNTCHMNETGLSSTNFFHPENPSKTYGNFFPGYSLNLPNPTGEAGAPDNKTAEEEKQKTPVTLTPFASAFPLVQTGGPQQSAYNNSISEIPSSIIHKNPLIFNNANSVFSTLKSGTVGVPGTATARNGNNVAASYTRLTARFPA